MNRIILVGNGFDLAHNLPTKYEDFINWYSRERLKGFENNKTLISEDPLCKLEMKNVDGVVKDRNSDVIPHMEYNRYNLLYSGNSLHEFFTFNPEGEFKGILDMISKLKGKFNVDSSPLFENITKSIETKGWVDIENEYYNLLRSFLSEKKYDNPKQLNDELDFIRTKLIEYFKLVQDKYINEGIINEKIREKIAEPFNKEDLSNEATEYFKKVTKFEGDDFLKKNVDYEFKITEHPQPENTLILDFNYTKTADLYLSNKKKIEIKHIHGDLEHPESVIFGYGDELDRDYKDLARLNDNEYLRNIKSIKYLESKNYHEVLSFIGWDKFQIYIMGHSCGNADRTLMNTLFEHKNCASIKPFYYQSKNGDDNYLDIVQNISRNFTDMKLMRDRVVNKEFCEPLPQNISKEKQEL
jgi:hypothetical protein